MAVPKRKTSRSNTRSRRANWKAAHITLTTCPQCRSMRRPHMACPTCGAYDQRRYTEAVDTEHQG